MKFFDGKHMRFQYSAGRCSSPLGAWGTTFDFYSSPDNPGFLQDCFAAGSNNLPVVWPPLSLFTVKVAGVLQVHGLSLPRSPQCAKPNRFVAKWQHCVANFIFCTSGAKTTPSERSMCITCKGGHNLNGTPPGKWPQKLHLFQTALMPRLIDGTANIGDKDGLSQLVKSLIEG